ncbi:hypothetical protein EGR_08524 [Echinococcus granulosus]|uniref:Uncharacterized protein n=1 Tax=Echinococcus granulosus TaxID=6210 RepID=W6U5Z1_ECHGR|nr:hypothetical protein EGR_08524 [Echinococcus granulosus]EUB56613.1 hypothetical protein EGR_08524 [Echinococcus granulosus]
MLSNNLPPLQVEWMLYANQQTCNLTNDTMQINCLLAPEVKGSLSVQISIVYALNLKQNDPTRFKASKTLLIGNNVSRFSSYLQIYTVRHWWIGTLTKMMRRKNGRHRANAPLKRKEEVVSLPPSLPSPHLLNQLYFVKACPHFWKIGIKTLFNFYPFQKTFSPFVHLKGLLSYREEVLVGEYSKHNAVLRIVFLSKKCFVYFLYQCGPSVFMEEKAIKLQDTNGLDHFGNCPSKVRFRRNSNVIQVKAHPESKERKQKTIPPFYLKKVPFDPRLFSPKIIEHTDVGFDTF